MLDLQWTFRPLLCLLSHVENIKIMDMFCGLGVAVVVNVRVYLIMRSRRRNTSMTVNGDPLSSCS